jgi:NADH:ubiquinone oxidoreductase subunit 4 (subunit M)
MFVLFSVPSFYGRYIFYIFNFTSFSFPFIFRIISISVFIVKLPIYGLHFWLPMAHVEAPTFGSIILAGILLKLGGVGLIRVLSLVDLNLTFFFISRYLFIFLCFSCIICCIQTDFKRLVAYSSVAHIIAIPLVYLVCSNFSFKALFLVMFYHGLSSPIIFSFVGYVYSILGSRQLVFIRGLLLLSPLFRIFLLIGFLYTLSAPPFPSFISEVYFLIASFSIRNLFS